MTRPFVQIQAANQILAFRRHLEGRLPRFRAFEGVVGIMLNGGMSRGYADQFSEIDITFYLEPEALQLWEHGKTPVAVGVTVLDGQLYDIKYYEHLKLLIEAGSMSPPDWQAQTGWDIPNGDPFYPLIRLDQDRIVLDRDALLRIGPEAMYAWHYAVLRAVRRLSNGIPG